MSINSFNQEKIQSISDLGLKNLVTSLYKFKGIDGVKLVQEALNLANASNLKVDVFTQYVNDTNLTTKEIKDENISYDTSIGSHTIGI